MLDYSTIMIDYRIAWGVVVFLISLILCIMWAASINEEASNDDST